MKTKQRVTNSTKPCVDCGANLPIDTFPENSERCLPCHNARVFREMMGLKPLEPVEPKPAITKKPEKYTGPSRFHCNICGDETESNFYPYYLSKCKVCVRKATVEYHKKKNKKSENKAKTSTDNNDKPRLANTPKPKKAEKEEEPVEYNERTHLSFQKEKEIRVMYEQVKNTHFDKDIATEISHKLDVSIEAVCMTLYNTTVPPNVTSNDIQRKYGIKVLALITKEVAVNVQMVADELKIGKDVAETCLRNMEEQGQLRLLRCGRERLYAMNDEYRMMTGSNGSRSEQSA